MAKRGQSGAKAKQTEHYRQMYKNTPNLCKSQVYNKLYAKLKSDKRLDRFIAVIQYCSTQGMSLEACRDTLIKSFPCYIDEKEITVECLMDMIKSYSDIAIAWGFGPMGDKITQIVVKNKALSLIEKTDSMQDIQIYSTLFGGVEGVSTDNKTVVNFNLTKK